MLTIRALGQLSVQLDGVSIDICRRTKNPSLLAYPLLHKDRPIPRDRLAFALWPDAPESKARANLRRHLHHPRHREGGKGTGLVVGDGTLTLENEQVRLNLSPEYEGQDMILKEAFKGDLSSRMAAEMAVIFQGITTSLPFLAT